MIIIKNKNKCSGCRACQNICPKQAITMYRDEKGALYPKVNKTNCIDCGLCERVCPIQNDNDKNMFESKYYVAVNKNRDDLQISASGGVFSALARYILNQNGFVVGCSLETNVMPKHILIEKKEDLVKLQGSKYVQSDSNSIYKQVKDKLIEGKMVLFSGTPCQCSALRKFLFKEYNKLICCELICHGVPSDQFFRDYLNVLERKLKGTIIDVRFRDKKRGWGALMKIVYLKNGRKKIKYLTYDESYYYKYFENGLTFRDSCYQCPFAKKERYSDITIGDFWGVQQYHSNINSEKGVSVCIVNTEKGYHFLNELKDYMYFELTQEKWVTKENGQLNSPSKYQKNSDSIWEIYSSQGASRLYEMYKTNHKKDIVKGFVKRNIPLSIKKIAKKILIKK